MSVGLEDLENLPATVNSEREARDQQTVQRILEMIRQLKPIDRQVILSYLEGIDAATIAEISGLSAANVATKIHRIKNILSRRFRQGGRHAE